MLVREDSAKSGRRYRSTGSKGADRPQLATHQEHAEHQRPRQHHHRGGRGRAVGALADAQDQQPERARVEYGADQVEPAAGLRGRRQELQRKHQGQGTDRHVDGEQPGPGRDREDTGRDGRPQRGRRRHRHRIEADALAQLVCRIDEADQRCVHAHHPGAAHALQHPRRGQRRQRPTHRAQQGRSGEQGQAVTIYPPVAHDLSQRGERQQARDQGQLIGVDHPDRGGRRRVQVQRDGRQHRVCDRGVERHHRHRHDDGGDRPAPASGGQAVERDGFGHAPAVSKADSPASRGRVVAGS